MSQITYLTTNEYQNKTSVQAQSCGGLVLTSSSAEGSSTHTSRSVATAQSGQISTSAVVEGIEKELGVDLDVSSDSEFHSILQKNGAGPLSGLLKMAYGTKKKAGTKK